MKCVTLCLAAVALGAASPAFATDTIECSSTISPTDGPHLSIVVGSAGIAQARLEQGNQSFITGVGENAPLIGQSWLDRSSLRLSIVNATAGTEILRLEAWRRAGTSYLGTMRYAGRTWRVRCTGED